MILFVASRRAQVKQNEIMREKSFFIVFTKASFDSHE